MEKEPKMWWEVPGHLEVKDGLLYIAGQSAIELAKQHGTPIFVYNLKRVADNYNRFYGAQQKLADRRFKILYAMKANCNESILKALAERTAGIDAVSPGEVERVADFFPPKDILFTGVSVSDEDLNRVIKVGALVNVDSFSQLEKLKGLGTKGLEISFRVDVGVEGAGGNWKTVTAGKESHGVPIKFGIPDYDILRAYKTAIEYGFRPVGIQMHIGSQWLGEELDEFFLAVDKLLEKAKEVNRVLGCALEFVDFGGGPGIRYKQSDNEFPLERYAQGVWQRVKNSGLGFKKVMFEPGRFIVGDAGVLLCKVTMVKERYGETIVGVNTGFNHIIRPALYGAYHEIINCREGRGNLGPVSQVTVAGNLCETGDVLAAKREMPIPQEGDVLAFHNAGAYCSSMASCYNLRELPQEVIII